MNLGKEKGKYGEKNVLQKLKKTRGWGWGGMGCRLKTTSFLMGHGSISDGRRQVVGGYLKKRKIGAIRLWMVPKSGFTLCFEN